MFRLPLRGLDLYRTCGPVATVVNLRRRLTRSEAAKQEVESQTNKRRTKFPRYQVQEVRHLAINLTNFKIILSDRPEANMLSGRRKTIQMQPM